MDAERELSGLREENQRLRTALTDLSVCANMECRYCKAIIRRVLGVREDGTPA